MMKQMYKDKQYRVVFSPEEQELYTRKGWSEDPNPGTKYVVHTAVEPTKAEAPAKPSAAELAKAKEKAEAQEEADATRKAAEAKTAAQNAPQVDQWK